MPEGAAITEQTEQSTFVAAGSAVSISVPETGRRLAFQDIRRQLTDTDLANAGTQKLILEMLFTAESERDEHRSYISRFHETDKRATVLDEKLNGNKVNEILFTVMVGVGSAIIGLAPFFWSNTVQGNNTVQGSTIQGVMCLVLGLILIIGATIGRIAHK